MGAGVGGLEKGSLSGLEAGVGSLVEGSLGCFKVVAGGLEAGGLLAGVSGLDEGSLEAGVGLEVGCLDHDRFLVDIDVSGEEERRRNMGEGRG